MTMAMVTTYVTGPKYKSPVPPDVRKCWLAMLAEMGAKFAAECWAEAGVATVTRRQHHHHLLPTILDQDLLTCQQKYF